MNKVYIYKNYLQRNPMKISKAIMNERNKMKPENCIIWQEFYYQGSYKRIVKFCTIRSFLNGFILFHKFTPITLIT